MRPSRIAARTRQTLVALAAAGAIACATTPRPRVFSTVDATRESPAVQEAERLAPQAFLLAEKLRNQADRAYRADDLAGAQILGEHAVAAYTHAVVLARLVKAEERLAQSRTKLAEVETRLAELDAEQLRIATEADDLELRARVLREALPLARSGPSSPEREAARFEAARNLALQARLLCSAARLIDARIPELEKHAGALAALDERLKARAGARTAATSKEPAVIDEAVRLRSACLQTLTAARRPATQKAPVEGAADALLAELGRSGPLAPFRDDRGVVVTLRGLFAGERLTPAAESQLADLGRVAKAHTAFPVLVVLHSAKGDPTAADATRAQAIADALARAGASKVEAHTAGSAQPVLDSRRAGAAERNARVEIVFVAPTF